MTMEQSEVLKFSRLRSKIAGAQEQYASLEEYRSGQMHNARDWLQEILERDIAAEHKFLRFQSQNWDLNTIIEVMEGVYTDYDYYNSGSTNSFSESLMELTHPYDSYEFWDMVCYKLESYYEAFSCGGLRERVRKLIAWGEVVVEKVVNNDSYVDDDSNASDWSNFVQLTYKTLIDYDVTNLHGTTLIPYPADPDDEHHYYQNNVACPFCAGGQVIVLVGDVEREQLDATYENIIKPRHIAKYHYSLTSDVDEWYKARGYWRLNFYIKCNNEYCGFSRPLVNEYDAEDRDPNYTCWQYNLNYWFPVSGLVYVNMNDKEIPHYPDLEELMTDRYFLEWVH